MSRATALNACAMRGNRRGMTRTRRSFLITAGASGVLLGCGGSTRAADHPKAGGDGGGEEDVTPGEDLMREPGVLRRVMFLYDEATGGLEAHREVPLDALAAGAGIIRRV